MKRVYRRSCYINLSEEKKEKLKEWIKFTIKIKSKIYFLLI